MTTLTKKMSEDLHRLPARDRASRCATCTRRSTRSSASRSSATCASASSTCSSASTCCARGSTCPRCRWSRSSTPTRRASCAARRRCIQTIGRAARNVDGRVLMYADKVTDAMRAAIDETDRRRAIQVAYNEEHDITASTIVKGISDIAEFLTLRVEGPEGPGRSRGGAEVDRGDARARAAAAHRRARGGDARRGRGPALRIRRPAARRARASCAGTCRPRSRARRCRRPVALAPGSAASGALAGAFARLGRARSLAPRWGCGRRGPRIAHPEAQASTSTGRPSRRETFRSSGAATTRAAVDAHLARSWPARSSTPAPLPAACRARRVARLGRRHPGAGDRRARHETTASDIKRQAELEARRTQPGRRARCRERRVTRRCPARADPRRGGAPKATALMLQRVGAMENEVSALDREPATGANRLTADLALLEGTWVTCYDAAGRKTAGAAPASGPRSPSATRRASSAIGRRSGSGASSRASAVSPAAPRGKAARAAVEPRAGAVARGRRGAGGRPSRRGADEGLEPAGRSPTDVRRGPRRVALNRRSTGVARRGGRTGRHFDLADSGPTADRCSRPRRRTAAVALGRPGGARQRTPVQWADRPCATIRPDPAPLRGLGR